MISIGISIGIFNIIMFRHVSTCFDGFGWFSMVFDKFWMVGAVSINSSGQKTTLFEKMSKKVKVLDGGGGLNKFLGPKNDILKKYVPKCHFS